jgi:hypothetical protein
MIYPVSVVIPHTKSRAQFFGSVCLPSVERCNPAQIIVIDREGGACEKRNEGASRAVCDYLLFVDDDAELMPGAIGRMLERLQLYHDRAFCYSDRIIVDHLVSPPKEQFFCSGPWSLTRLQGSNYIDTCSLVRKVSCPGFDPAIKRLQDWDLWLTIAGRGEAGVYLPGHNHKMHRIDKGISDKVSYEESALAVRQKHGLI